MLLARLLVGFQSLPPLPTSKLGPTGADSWVGGFVYILGFCVSLQRTLLWSLEFLPPLQRLLVFTVRGFETLFPCAGTLGCAVCLISQLFLPVYLQGNVRSPGPPANTSPFFSFCHATHPLPTPTRLNEYFFFNSLIVRLPYSSIFCLFWFVFVLKFVVFLWLCKEAQCVYLCLHLGRKSVVFNIQFYVSFRCWTSSWDIRNLTKWPFC